MIRQAVPTASLDTMLASLSNNTLKQYEVTFKIWWHYCQENRMDALCSSVPKIMQFLSIQFNKGASYGTLNSHKSALSLIIGSRIGKDERIKRLLKGFYKSKPPMPRYKATWNPSIVLNTLKTWHPCSSLSLETLTKKVVTLIALCTAQRVQTLSLMKISNITCLESGIHINITDLIKTSAPDRPQPVLALPFYKETEICPAASLQYYINYTKDIRNTIDNLFITTKRPYKAATPSTLSRWIKTTLKNSGIDTNIFKSHSVRHASTSSASIKGVSIDIIRNTAGWTGSSQTFAKFYNRPIVRDPNNFANTILSL
ncbi:uncharacterized protein LOC125242260 [Leguminivora glycinivorella]|uniref:uncharacterized protein LOC125242260 n=1 Tax=Leguminivora glycinivorella TaxID=1035111 RepID=UPI00200EF2C9|nr:uncharacterized protein LOC125234427 isoform X2 [Leguminivora glycinivorella]XP_048006960.1 uncharacterized protein LOC125242260 [Leguminivora glycinivorella]